VVSYLLAIILLGFPARSRLEQFQSIEVSMVPRESLNPICSWDKEEDCWQDFKDHGSVRSGQINDGGEPAYVIYPGYGWSGTGGDSYFLVQRRGGRWVPLYSEDGSPVWQVRYPRFDILPIVRNGYHDLRVAQAWCLKWDGRHYVSYEDEDYRSLSPEWFDASDWEEADIFWMIRYRGMRKFHFDPQWFAVPEDLRASAEIQVDDPGNNLVWAAMFKGGVWGVRGNRAFLLLPQPAYQGAEMMELSDGWVVIHGEALRRAPPVVGRYNPATGEFRLERSKVDFNAHQ